MITTDGWAEPRVVIAINGTMPGPLIEVHEQQIVRAHVHNNMRSEAITLHFHGQRQRGTPWMDGVAFVTQCPVLPGQTFTYQVNDSLWLFFFHWLECCSSLTVLCYKDRLSRIRSMTFCDCSSSCLSLVGVLFVTQCPVLPDRPSRIRSLTFCDCSSFLSFIGWSAVHHSVSCATRTDFHVSGHWHSVIVLPSCPVVRHTVSCATRTKLHVAGQWQSVIFTPLCLLLVRV